MQERTHLLRFWKFGPGGARFALPIALGLLRAALISASIFAVSSSWAQQPDAPGAPEPEYEILPHRGDVFGHVTLSDGLSDVFSTNSSLGNRFRLAIDFLFGPGYRYDIGYTVIDITSSGENDPSVGSISRYGSGPTFGYYFLPEKLWLMYYLDMNSVAGDRVSGTVGAYGHQLELGYRVYSHQSFNVAVTLAYTYIPGVSVPVLDVNSNTTGNANYPLAQIWTLGFTLGYDTQ